MTVNFTLFDLPEPHIRALDFLLKQIPPNECLWVLTGSAGLRLQGVDIPIHDLDIQTDGKTIYFIQKRLAEFMKTPVHLWESPSMRSLDGRAEIEGIEIELLANVAHLLPNGSWSTYTDFSRLLWLDWHERRVAVFPLADEADAYESMGRNEKAALIRETIKTASRS